MNQIISDINNNKIYKNLYLLPGFNYSTNNDNSILHCDCNYSPHGDVISNDKFNELFKKIHISKNSSPKKRKKPHIFSKRSAKKDPSNKKPEKPKKLKISRKAKL